MKTVMCELCLNTLDSGSDEFVVLEETVKKMLEMVLLKPIIRDNENLVVCKTCMENLRKFFKFKVNCLATEKSLYPYIKSSNKEVDLKAVYFKERTIDKTFKFTENDEVCRFCLNLNKSNTATALKSEMLKYDEFFGNFMPELALEETGNAVVCELCHLYLEEYAKFVQTCLDKELNIIRQGQTCAKQDYESKTNLQSLEICEETIKKEPEFDNNLAPEFENVPLKIEQGMDIEEDPVTYMEEIVNEKLNKSEDYFCLPISKVENPSDCIKIEEVEIKSDREGESDALDGGIDQTENIWQIISEEKKNVSCKSETVEKYMNEGSCEIEVYEHPDHSNKFRYENFQLFNEHNSKSKQSYCHISELQVEAESVPRAHILTCESNVEKRFQIENNDLNTHTPVHGEVLEIKLFRCEICNFETKRECYLKSHMVTHKKSSEISMYQREFCNFATKTKKHIQPHVVTYQVHQVMYKCELCIFESKHKSSLKQHMRNHRKRSDNNKYNCEICTFGTIYKNGLKKHMIMHKNQSDLKMYKCELCDYLTKRRESLKNHMIKHKDPSEIEMYKCELCTYETRYKGCLKSHVIIHKDPTEAEMYKCGLCIYTTKHEAYLKRHIKTHKDKSNTVVFKCDICFYVTKHEGHFTKHMLFHERIKRQREGE